MSAKNGGPAFPCVYVKHAPGEVGNNVAIKEHGEGVTVRDYFAGKALAGMLADPNVLIGDSHTERLADLAYEMADAMLKARAK